MRTFVRVALFLIIGIGAYLVWDEELWLSLVAPPVEEISGALSEATGSDSNAVAQNLGELEDAIQVSGYDFLVNGAREDSGYGLYSYLIFATNDGAARARNRAALEALLAQLAPVGDLFAADFTKSEINITYVPTRETPPEGAAADWFVANHDFALGLRLLGYVGAEIENGPYLVSYLAPLSGGPPAVATQVLVQDLGWVPPEMVGLWVRAFIEDAGKPAYWDKAHLSDVMLTMRTAVAVIAEPLSFSPAAAAERFVALKPVVNMVNK